MSGPVSLIADVPKRLVRWPLFVVVLVVVALGVAGRADLPMLNAFIAACAVLMLAGMLIIDPGLAFGALAPGLALTGLFLARAAHEDRFLTRHLEGHPDYAARVRFRLVPGVW